MSRRLRIAVGVLIIAAVATGGALWALAPGVGLSTAPTVPTARVIRGNLDLKVYLNGEMQTDTTVTLVPPQAGIPLRLVTIAETGEVVKAGDVVMTFDPADQQYALEQNQSQLLEAEQEIIKSRANQEVRTQQTNTDILTARFNVRRAEMDTLTPANFVGANEYKAFALALTEAKRRLAELEGLASSRQTVDRASIAALEQRRNTARTNAARAEAIIAQLDVKAPIDGSIVVRENRDGQQVMFSGMTLPEYRTGDSVPPGRVVMEIVDTTRVQIRARIGEQERTSIAPGYTAKVRADGAGGEWTPASVDTVAGLASRADGPSPVRKFDVTLKVKKPEQFRPGTTVRVVIDGKPLTNVLHLPRQAVFEKDGQTIVYVREAGHFIARPVTIVGRTEGRVAVTGVTENAEIALLNPTTITEEKGGPAGPVMD
jgi:HlyD family secretion protein